MPGLKRSEHEQIEGGDNGRVKIIVISTEGRNLALQATPRFLPSVEMTGSFFAQARPARAGGALPPQLRITCPLDHRRDGN